MPDHQTEVLMALLDPEISASDVAELVMMSNESSTNQTVSSFVEGARQLLTLIGPAELDVIAILRCVVQVPFTNVGLIADPPGLSIHIGESEVRIIRLSSECYKIDSGPRDRTPLTYFRDNVSGVAELIDSRFRIQFHRSSTRLGMLNLERE